MTTTYLTPCEISQLNLRDKLNRPIDIGDQICTVTRSADSTYLRIGIITDVLKQEYVHILKRETNRSIDYKLVIRTECKRTITRSCNPLPGRLTHLCVDVIKIT